MKLKKYLIALLTVAFFTGCNEDIIEVTPENSVTPEIALARVSGINALVLSAYKRVNEFGYYGQNQILNAEALADNLVIANNTGRYTGQVVNTVGSHFGTWSAAPYRIINDANLILKYADAAEPALGSTEAIAAPLRNRYKGEAYFLRALAYHDLVKVYGYEPGREVNGFNLGVILRTTPVEGVVTADKRSRATNLEIYNQIEADLLQAIALLPDENAFATVTGDPNVVPPAEKWFRASKQAARALLARVYLYWEKYAEANTQATAVLAATTAYPTAGGGTGRTLVASGSYASSWSTTTHPESIFEISILAADWSTVDGVNNSLASVTNSSPTGAANAQFAVAGSAELIAAFEPGDVRRNVWVDNAGRNECKKWQGEKGTFLENVPIIRISEVYLIAAEARANSGDEPGARTALNALRAQRGLGATALTGQALLDLIENERRVELAFEGHRFFDLKRLGKGITKPVSLGVTDLAYTDYRMLANIPVAEVNYNSLLTQNPNY
jgi:hypothetical protein